jgi:glutaredoxin
MASRVVIYGKDSCPYTSAARADFAKRGYTVDYRNVRTDPAQMREFLTLGKGRREVPLMLEEDQVTIGFGGT